VYRNAIADSELDSVSDTIMAGLPGIHGLSPDHAMNMQCLEVMELSDSVDKLPALASVPQQVPLKAKDNVVQKARDSVITRFRGGENHFHPNHLFKIRKGSDSEDWPPYYTDLMRQCDQGKSSCSFTEVAMVCFIVSLFYADSVTFAKVKDALTEAENCNILPELLSKRGFESYNFQFKNSTDRGKLIQGLIMGNRLRDVSIVPIKSRDFGNFDFASGNSWVNVNSGYRPTDLHQRLLSAEMHNLDQSQSTAMSVLPSKRKFDRICNDWEEVQAKIKTLQGTTTSQQTTIVNQQTTLERLVSQLTTMERVLARFDMAGRGESSS